MIWKNDDAMWTEETMNDYFDAGVQDDKFALTALMNDKCKVKIKTPVGDTDRIEMKRIEMQGTVPAPLKCAIQIDTLGKYCYTYNTGLYLYKDACVVPPLSMIDDIAGVADCSDGSLVLNSIINAKIEAKKLNFNLKKCINMHIGPGIEECQKLKIHGVKMKTQEIQKYLGDTISSSGSQSENIKERVKTGFKAISQIKSLVKDISFG